MKAANVFQVIR